MSLDNVCKFANTGKLPSRLREKLAKKMGVNCGKRYGAHLMSGKYHKSRCPSSDVGHPQFFKGIK